MMESNTCATSSLSSFNENGIRNKSDYAGVTMELKPASASIASGSSPYYVRVSDPALTTKAVLDAAALTKNDDIISKSLNCDDLKTKSFSASIAEISNLGAEAMKVSGPLYASTVKAGHVYFDVAFVKQNGSFRDLLHFVDEKIELAANRARTDDAINLSNVLSQISALQSQLNMLQTNVEMLKTEVNTLQAENAFLKDKITEVCGELPTIEDQRTPLQAHVHVDLHQGVAKKTTAKTTFAGATYAKVAVSAEGRVTVQDPASYVIDEAAFFSSNYGKPRNDERRMYSISARTVINPDDMKQAIANLVAQEDEIWKQQFRETIKQMHAESDTVRVLKQLGFKR